MKKVLKVLLILLIPVFILCGCFLLILALDYFMSKDKVIDSLGRYESEIFLTYGGFQDYTDYAKYTYNDVDFSGNKYFERITPESEKELVAHISDFKLWVAAHKENDPENELVVGYDFDYASISDDDYVYIYDDPDYPYLGNYNVYFFDTETMTLYYFHNNI